MVFFDWIEKRPFWQWLTLILIIGVLLRLPNIGRDSLWLDEAISYLASQLPVGQIFNNSVQSSHPPMYYFFLKLWGTAVPQSDTALRGLGILWSLLLIPIIAQFAKELFHNQKLALLTAFLVAISPFHILYSHELRMYTQVMFFRHSWHLGVLAGATRGRLALVAVVCRWVWHRCLHPSFCHPSPLCHQYPCPA